MRADALAFAEKNLAPAKEPRYTIEIAFTDDFTDLYYLTSHSDGATPGGAVVEANVIEDISGTSQRLYPDEGRAEIGAISFNVVDAASALTTKLNDKMAFGKALRGKRVRVYMGFKDLAWADYSLIQTQLVERIVYKDGVYTFQCRDVQRQMREKIFDIAETTLSAPFLIGDTTINVYKTSAFEMLEHGTSYSDAPSATVGYVKIDDEAVRYTGKDANTFTGLTRGVLNTKEADHEIDATASADRRTKVEEYVYLEMPAVKLVYAILTGDLYGQGAATLPATWRLGISTSYVRQADFTGIGTDWWDTADDTVGRVVRFTGLEKQDGKKFVEQELLLLQGAFMPVYGDGALGLRRMTQVLTDSAYVKQLDESNIVSHGALTHDMNKIFNAIAIKWNWNDQKEQFTRTNVLVDAGSITTHGQAPTKTMEFRGLHGARHTAAHIAKLFDAFRDRYTGPPQRLKVKCLPSLNVLEVGDVVRTKTNTIQDYVTGQAIDRSMEVQSIQTNWVTGGASLQLFGSSQVAAPISTTVATVLPDSWYTSLGTDITTVLTTTDIGGVIHITANGNLPDGTYYCDADLTIDSGVTVTFNDNVRLHVKGFLTINGALDGKGRGLSGGAGGTTYNNAGTGTAGYLGSTRGSGGIKGAFVRSGLIWAESSEGILTVGLHESNDGAGVSSIDITWDGSNLLGIPPDLRGSSGAGGQGVDDVDANEFQATGGAGGAGGASLAIVCRGAAFGASGSIDTSGTDGVVGANQTIPLLDTLTLYAGSGGGGAPGACLFLLDDGTATIPDLAAKLTANYGATVVQAKKLPTPGREYLSVGQYHSYYEGLGSPGASMITSAWRAIYIPDNLTPDPDAGVIEAPTSLTLASGTAYLLIGGDGTVLSRIFAQWTATNDQRAIGYELQYKKSSDSTWLFAADVLGSTTVQAYIVPVQDGIDYDVRVRASDQFRNTSNWLTVTSHTVVGKTQPPPDVGSFLVQRQPDGTREFSWVLAAPPVDHAGYKVRAKLGTGFTWAQLDPLHEGLLVASPFETNQLAAGTYTAGIKAVDTTGNESTNAMIIESTLGDPRIRNIVASEDPRKLGWPGTLTVCWVSNDGNLYATDTKTWADLGTDGITWATWASWARAPNSPIVYEHPRIDIGVVAPFIPLVSVTANGSVVIEESNSDDDIGYTSWAAAGTLITARYVKIRVTVTNASTLADITQMIIILSADVVDEDITDLDTSTLTGANRIGVGDIRLPITKTYQIIKSVGLALQNVGAGWSWELIDKDTAVGPRIKIYNASDVLADATIDAYVKGL